MSQQPFWWTGKFNSKDGAQHLKLWLTSVLLNKESWKEKVGQNLIASMSVLQAIKSL